MCVLPENHRFSFSQLSLYDTCPMAFKLRYLDGVKDEGNAFSEYGTLGHALLEEWAKGQLPDILLAEEFERRYDEEVKHPFPPFPRGMSAKYYEAARDYFDSFTGFGNVEILDVEQRFVFTVEGGRKPYPFVGVVDLVVRDQITGEIWIIDHKSKSSAQMKKDFSHYRRQLYTYARFVYDKYGTWPSRIGFNLFRAGGEMVWEDFSMAGYEETMRWIVGKIEAILDEREWKIGISSFFCRYLCSALDLCPAKDTILYAKKGGSFG